MLLRTILLTLILVADVIVGVIGEVGHNQLPSATTMFAWETQKVLWPHRQIDLATLASNEEETI